MRRFNLRVLFVCAKLSVAGGLLAAMALPFASCDARGLTYTVSVELNDIPSVIAFMWPLPLVIFQAVALLRNRRFRLVLVTECVVAVVAWIQLQLQLVGVGLITLGIAAPGPGYELSNACNEGYFLLAVLELITNRYIGNGIRRPAAASQSSTAC